MFVYKMLNVVQAVKTLLAECKDSSRKKKICTIDFTYYVTETRRPFFDYDQKKETVADFVLAWQGEFGMENNPDAVVLCCTPVGIFHTIENFKRKIKPYSFLMIGLNLKPCLS